MIDTILDMATDYTFQVVALGTGMLGLISGVIGTFVTLKKESLLGDALSHAALPGIAISFLIVERKEMMLLLLGASLSGLLGMFLIQILNKSKRVKFDSALSLILSSFFGFGLVLLTYIQASPNANQAGLDNFIFGQANALLRRDIFLISITSSILLIFVGIFWKELKIFTFDTTFTQTIGYSIRTIRTIFSIMVMLVIVIGLESVGVILMSSLLVGPAVAARQWSNRFSRVVITAGFFGLSSGVIGTAISSAGRQLPTGPTIVLVLSVFIISSLLFAPKRGIVHEKWSNHLKKRKLIEWKRGISNDN